MISQRFAEDGVIVVIRGLRRWKQEGPLKRLQELIEATLYPKCSIIVVLVFLYPKLALYRICPVT